MKKRKLYQILLSERKNRKVTIILGPRQVGKTTLLKQVYEAIGTESPGVFLDLDILSNYEKVSSYEGLVNYITLEGYRADSGGMFYLFLDEFLRYPGFSMILKNVYDNHSNIKIYATGSSSLTIKDEIQESLAGRKHIHYLFPLDFEEYILFKDNAEALKHLNHVDKLRGKNIKTSLLRTLLEEYLIYGGYPEVALTAGRKIKAGILDSIFDLYVKKDLVEYLNFRKLLNVKRLIEVLAVNHGQKIKYEELGRICSLKEYEVRNYLEVLKETFLITEIRPFFTNKNKEIVKIPKIYFVDPGVRNYFTDNFAAMHKRADGGFLFEGYVLGELLQAGYGKIKYWQDKNKREVDFILDRGEGPLPVEVKFKERLKQDDLTGLTAFRKQYPDAQRSILINMGEQYRDDSRQIEFVLPYRIGKIPDGITACGRV